VTMRSQGISFSWVCPTPLFRQQCVLIIAGILVTLTMPMIRKTRSSAIHDLFLEARLGIYLVFIITHMKMGFPLNLVYMQTWEPLQL
jgi:hypothetical protein